MAAAKPVNQPKSRWSDQEASLLSEEELLLYRSNLLGSDLAITNFGGGNTSAKVTMRDPLSGEDTEVLWVKGSGGDLGSMALDGFATLYQQKLLNLENIYRGREHEDEMVAYLQHCTFNVNPRAPSIDTPLHAYIPYTHVDHMHPDSVIAIAAAKNGKEISREIFGGRIGWIEWQRPGFDLGLQLREASRDSSLVGVVLESHGLLTWANSAKDCYENTIAVIAEAASYLADKASVEGSFGGAIAESENSDSRRAIASSVMPLIRNKIAATERKVGHFCDSLEVLEFVNSARFEELASVGTSCPDHFLRTKIKPAILPTDILSDPAQLDQILEAYRADYQDYYDNCKHDDSPEMRDPNPVVYLMPGVGMITFANDKTTARLACEFYINAINVMRGSTSVSEYVGLPLQEAFDIEYWLLEEAKLQRMPPRRALHGQIALVTGGAGGIGIAVAREFLDNGACVFLMDINEPSLQSTAKALQEKYGDDAVRTKAIDVTDEDAVKSAFDFLCGEYGGIDVVVANAGIASSASIGDTTMEMWRQNFAVLVEGYFLIARDSLRLMHELGGSVVFVASKNALVAAPNASAYATAKSAELHLARCLALEGAPSGVRVNTVNPDAVIRGSRIWSGEWKKARASTHGIGEDDLEEHYRRRSLLGRNVLPEDVAKAVLFFATDDSAKSTGNILNVDAGNAGAFVR